MVSRLIIMVTECARRVLLKAVPLLALGGPEAAMEGEPEEELDSRWNCRPPGEFGA